jgi:phosphohistidine phosphatase
MVGTPTPSPGRLSGVSATQRRLVVVRHAKSARPDDVADARRPLTERGRRDAPEIGRWLRTHVGRLDAAVCSPALRARTTLDLVVGALEAPPAIRVDDRIYDATPHDLLAVVHDLPVPAATVALVGHNPGLEALAALLGGEPRPMRTSSVAVLSWTGAWTDAANGAAVLEAHATPRG